MLRVAVQSLREGSDKVGAVEEVNCSSKTDGVVQCI